MTRLWTFPALAVLLACSASAQDGAQDAAATEGFASEQQKGAYAVGLNIGKGLKAQAGELDLEAIVEGVRDGFTGEGVRLTDQEVQATLAALQEELMAKQQQQLAAAGQKNLAKSGQFLEQNKQRPGVETTASGLQYEVVEAGSGPSPAATDTVRVHYRGTLADGTVFDSSYERGQPATFPVNRVIAGWQEALQLMKVGGKWKLYVPPELGYGERGSGPKIGPNEALVFEVELLEIVTSEQ